MLSTIRGKVDDYNFVRTSAALGEKWCDPQAWSETTAGGRARLRLRVGWLPGIAGTPSIKGGC